MVNRNKKLIFGILLMVCSYGFIFNKIKNLEINFANYSIDILGSALLVLFVILAFLNIIAESVKWKMLLSSIYPVNLKKALKMILAGFTSGIFTPSKLGEPIGRVLSLHKGLWAKATVLNYFSGFLQNGIIFLMGFVFLSLKQLNGARDFKIVFNYSLMVIILLLCLFLVIWIFRNRIGIKFTKFSFFNQFSVLRELELSIYGRVSLISLVRYMLYCSQLALLLFIFASNNQSIDYLMLIPIYFMCITVVPSFVLADLGVRNSIALLLFSQSQINEVCIMMSVSVLWLVNQVVPAIMGSYTIIKFHKNKAVH